MNWFRKERDGRVRVRIQVVLRRAEKWSYEDIARGLGIAVSTIHAVLHRWQAWRENGLLDGRRNNGSTKVSIEYLSVLEDTLKSPAADAGWTRPTWTREALALTLEHKTGVRVGATTVGRALRRLGARHGRPKPIVLCPWSRTKRTRRLSELRRLAENLPPGEVVLFIDEVDIHLNPKIGPDWMLPGTQRTIVTPGKNCKRYVAGAWNQRTSEMTWVESDHKNSLLFLALCQQVLAEYPRARRIHFVLDNFVIHSSKITQRGLARMGDRIVLHFLPPYCPDDNRIEIRWKILHDEVTRNHQHKSIERLMEAVRTFLNRYSRKTKAALEKAA